MIIDHIRTMFGRPAPDQTHTHPGQWMDTATLELDATPGLDHTTREHVLTGLYLHHDDPSFATRWATNPQHGIPLDDWRRIITAANLSIGSPR